MTAYRDTHEKLEQEKARYDRSRMNDTLRYVPLTLEQIRAVQDAITTDLDAMRSDGSPEFEDTIRALEHADQELTRVFQSPSK